MMDKAQVKSELLASACKGIDDYLKTTRGARLRAVVTVIGGSELQIACQPEPGHGPEFFNVKITNPWS